MSVETSPPAARCFHESDPAVSLIRRSAVEGAGTGLLALAMVGAGLAVSQASGGERLVAALMVAIAIAGALVGLIVSLGKVSGGHFNPLITIVQWYLGERRTSCAIAYVTAQVVGALAGAVLARFLFDAASPDPVATATPRLVCSELVAACGLLIVVLGCAKSSRWETGPFAVGSWLVAAIVATPSTSFANPAVTIAAVAAAGPVTLSPGTALAFVIAQLAGAAMAALFSQLVHPGEAQ